MLTVRTDTKERRKKMFGESREKYIVMRNGFTWRTFLNVESAYEYYDWVFKHIQGAHWQLVRVMED